MARFRPQSTQVLYSWLECKAIKEVTVSVKYQIVLPQEARKALQVKPGDKLIVVVRGGRVIVLEKPQSHHAAIRGLARRSYPNGYLEKERRSWN